jgi:hypothetical protein
MTGLSSDENRSIFMIFNKTGSAFFLKKKTVAMYCRQKVFVSKPTQGFREPKTHYSNGFVTPASVT